MKVPASYVRYQAPMLATFANLAIKTALGKTASSVPATPGPMLRETVMPRPNALIDDYIRWCGGRQEDYAGIVPPHLFPQWGFPLMSRTLADIPYKLTGVLNQGARMEIVKDLPRNEPLELQAQLVDIQDDGYKARLHQRLITGTASAPEALIADVYAVVLLKKKKGSGTAPENKQPVFKEIDQWDVPLQDGLSFALLTGDFNPIHWVAPYAKMAGFKNKILHGFGSFSRTAESLRRANAYKAISEMDVRFVKPLVMPNSVKVLQSTRKTKAGYKVQVQDKNGSLCMAGTVQF